MNLTELKASFHNKLEGIYASEEIDSFFVLLSEAWLGYSRLDLALKGEAVVSSEVVKKIENAIQRLQKEEPVQYILGSTEFYGLEFKVSPDTLIPRPETEELVDWIIREHSGCKSILDIGTGSGCIAISVAKNFPDCTLTAIDNSEKALKVARKNSEFHHARVRFQQVDILEVERIEENYDLIVSNPPYVRESEKEQMENNVLKHEPPTALYVQDDDPLLFYRQIAKLSKEALNHKGWLLFEINEYLGEEMISLLKAFGFNNIELRKDFRGKHRFIRGQFLNNDEA